MTCPANIPMTAPMTSPMNDPADGRTNAPDMPVDAHGDVHGHVHADSLMNGLMNGLRRFNALPPGIAEAALLACCGSRRWAQRMAAHRPYHDVDSLLAAADEASYDLSHADLAEALAAEASSGPPHSAPAAARTALRAAHAAYESSFGHAFVISLDEHRPEEYLDQVLAGIRARLAHEPDHERSVSADELRRLARGRLARLLVSGPSAGATGPAAGATGPSAGATGPTAAATGPTAGVPGPTAGVPGPTTGATNLASGVSGSGLTSGTAGSAPADSAA
ncbi:2-oxo-4-hydroxy-4-carboxy-5-ureidoimidazoline decarboxylase [Streptomyces sp. NPDC056937]|uniref:2-oxo-4-hydroxy-4-carboxy-5-ureidoimidazoline decarboxylase n=1 Tax=Streptomyces sp. NPDC056937 TaxID=3345969 RepID=UPI00363E2FD7